MHKFKMLFMKLTPGEKKVLEATTENVAWGPTTNEMDEITSMARSFEHKSSILNKIFEHFRDNGKFHWKQVYKNLLLVEHMAIHADNECIRYFKDNIRYVEALKDGYKYRDDDGSDKGINVRKRAETVADLLNDEELEDKRKEGQAKKAKFSQCVSNEGGHYQANIDSRFAKEEEPTYQKPTYQAPAPVQQAPQQTYQAPAPAPVAAPVRFAAPPQAAQIRFDAPAQQVHVEQPAPAPAQQPDLLDDLFGSEHQQIQHNQCQQQPQQPQPQFQPAPAQQYVPQPGAPQVKPAAKSDLTNLLDF